MASEIMSTLGLEKNGFIKVFNFNNESNIYLTINSETEVLGCLLSKDEAITLKNMLAVHIEYLKRLEE